MQKNLAVAGTADIPAKKQQKRKNRKPTKANAVFSNKEAKKMLMFAKSQKCGKNNAFFVFLFYHDTKKLSSKFFKKIGGKKMIFYAKGKKMWNYPKNSTIQRLKKQGYSSIVWRNGDFLNF